MELDDLKKEHKSLKQEHKKCLKEIDALKEEQMMTTVNPMKNQFYLTWNKRDLQEWDNIINHRKRNQNRFHASYVKRNSKAKMIWMTTQAWIILMMGIGDVMTAPFKQTPKITWKTMQT